MPAIVEPSHRDRRLAPITIGLFAAAVIVFQLADLGRKPLEAWDESRLAVNAIEMLESGHRLVTTYDFRPDLWNTKPPLAINLMAWSMQLLGTTAFAARLPAALAACATVLLVTLCVRRVTASLWCGIAAGALLAAAPSFNGYHGGQTGDYDAILALFTTAYGFAVFALIEREGRAPALALGTGGLVGLAILTKGVAGIIPGVGLAGYALIFGWRRLSRKLGDYAIVAVCAGAIGAMFYGVRDAVGDGYLAAVAGNELGGRYTTALERHAGSKWFYLLQASRYLPGRLWPALVTLPLLAAEPARRLALFSFCQVAGVLLVFSSAATKFPWYLIPAVPFIATVVALAGLGVARATRRLLEGVAVAVRIALAAIVILCVVDAVRHRYFQPILPATPSRAFDTLIAAAVERHMIPLTIVDTGFHNDSGFVNYSPTLRFYALAAARRGIRIDRAITFDALGSAKSFGSCDPAIRGRIAAYGTPVWAGAGCVLAAR